jgi:MraZ protein
VGEIPVAFALLYGEHEVTIDDKKRLLVPSEIRKRLEPAVDGSAFFIVIGENLLPWLYPEKVYEAMVADAEQELSPDEDQLAFDQMHFALASRLEWDKQGRILLPDKILKRTGIGKDCVLNGARNHFELWNRADWEARREMLLNNRKEIALKQRQKRMIQGV